jgi:hypothetical protein
LRWLLVDSAGAPISKSPAIESKPNTTKSKSGATKTKPGATESKYRLLPRIEPFQKVATAF